MPSLPDTNADMLMGIGGSPEAVLTAAALKCLGGDIQCKLWPRNAEERAQAEKLGLPLDRVLTIDDLVRGNDVFFALTGVTDGELVKGVHYFPHGATTETLVMRSRSGTVRRIQAVHNFEKLEHYADLAGSSPLSASTRWAPHSERGGWSLDSGSGHKVSEVLPDLVVGQRFRRVADRELEGGHARHARR